MGFLAFGHGLKEDINPSESLTEPYPAGVTAIQDRSRGEEKYN